jgi:microcin C transport system permease protein
VFFYILRRLLLMIPTLFGIMVLNFLIIQLAPGGPVEKTLADIQGRGVSATARLSEAGGGEMLAPTAKSPASAAGIDHSGGGEGSRYRGAQGLDPDLVKAIEKQYGFDQPLWTRFWHMMANYARLDFGTSFFRDRAVIDLVLEKLPVSISLGLWTTLLVYLISIPLGIAKAQRDGSRFDGLSSAVIVVGYAIPAFLFAVALLILFAGGSYWSWFPLRGLSSAGAEGWSWWQRALDYGWHIALPTVALVIGGFASLTMLTKNSFVDEIRKQYVITARAKGLSARATLYRHVFRNAMLLVIAGFPAALMSILFTGSVLIEVIFSLDGLGLLGFEAAINRDYPVIFGTLFVFTLLGLVLNLLSDLTYSLIDPRIHFGTRQGA